MGGVDWIFSDHLRNQMYHLWSTHEHWRPVIDPSGARWLWAMGGLSVIVFEMAVVVLILFRRTRVMACASGLTFHVANALTLNILFAGLMWCYVALIDWDRLTSRLLPPRTPVRVRQTRRSSVIIVTLVGLGLIIPNVAMGVLGNNNGWPLPAR